MKYFVQSVAYIAFFCLILFFEQSYATSISYADTLYWSNPSSWNGIKPVDGDTVEIPENTVYLLDEDSPLLDGLMIHGKLVFARQNLHLQSKWIMIHGDMEVGNESQPFVHQARITLTGNDTTQSVMGMGTRGIMVMGGSFVLVGNSPATTWTKISQHALASATLIHVLEAQDWEVGDEIILSPTDYYEAATGESVTQKLSISAINGSEISFNEPLTAFRWGQIQYATTEGMSLSPGNTPSIPLVDEDSLFTPLELDERAFVGHLTRNIVIESPDDELWQNDGFGVHIMIMGTSSEVKLDGIEIRRGGQQGRLRRYPFHWHMLSYSGTETLADATGHYIKKSTINSSMNRGIVIHGTNGVLVQNNVIFDTRGHGIFTENAVERRNTIDRNLVLHVRNPALNLALKNHEIGGFGSSGFWISNPDNRITNNVSGDNEGIGFWLAFPEQPFGESAEVLHTDGQIIRPNRLLFGEFSRNTAFSNRVNGIRLDDPEVNEAGDTFPYYFRSTTDGREIGWPATTLRRFLLYNYSTWKNGSNGIWDRAVWPDNFSVISADNCGRFFAGSGANGVISRSLVIGTSLNHLMNGTDRPQFEDAAGGNQTPVAFATYHSAFDIHNNIVVNFPVLENQRSGAFATEDYYLRPVDKGHIRNVNNLLIQSQYGLKLNPIASYYALAGALWDPFNAWGGIGSNNYFVYDNPFLTYGQATQAALPAVSGGVITEGPFYGINDFVVNNANDSQWDLMALRFTRFDQNLDSVGSWSLDEAPFYSVFLGHMRHAALHPSGIFTLDFPTIDPVTDVHFSIENMLTESDSLILGVEYDASFEITQVYSSTWPNFRSDSHAEYPESWALKRVFTEVNSIQEVMSSSEIGVYWHDLSSNRVWMKIRGGMQQYFEWSGQAHLYSETDDEKLYRLLGIRVLGRAKQEVTLNQNEGWYLLTNPYQTQTYSDFLGTLWTQGALGADSQSGNPNTFDFNPNTASYTPIANLNTFSTPGKGITTFVYSDSNLNEQAFKGFPKQIYAIGTRPNYPFSYEISYQNNENLANDGWNLIGLPDSLSAQWPDQFTLNQIDSFAYFWDNYHNSWVFTDGTDSEDTLKSIQPFTGFYVKANDETASISFNSSSELPKQAVTKSTINPRIHVELSSGSLYDDFWLEFNPLAKEAKDQFDAYSLQPLSSSYVQIGSDIENALFSKISNPLPENEQMYSLFTDMTEAEGTIRIRLFDFPSDKSVSFMNSEDEQLIEISDTLSFLYSFPVANQKKRKENLKPTPRVQSALGLVQDLFLIVSPKETVAVQESLSKSFQFELLQNYPNPFNPSTTIRYSVAKNSAIQIDIFDVTGRKVTSLLNTTKAAGNYTIEWNAHEQASGIYFVRMKTIKGEFSQKIMLIK